MKDYEEVSQFTLDAETRERLLTRQTECVFNWRMRDGWPLGVVMSYLWRQGKIWTTASGQRPRVAAVRRDNRVSVVVSSAGTELGPMTVTIRGHCALHDDAETKRWFYPDLARTLIPADEPRQRRFIAMLDSPRRVILCVTPEKYISFDSAKMGQYWRGGAASS